jgi:hypothetical protein
MAMSPPSDPVSSEGAAPVIDVEQARRLLDALDRDLRGLGADRQELAVLEAEVDELRRVLHAEGVTPEELQTGLHGMRDRLHDFPEELKGDAFRAGRYLAELGRILGLS